MSSGLTIALFQIYGKVPAVKGKLISLVINGRKTLDVFLAAWLE